MGTPPVPTGRGSFDGGPVGAAPSVAGVGPEPDPRPRCSRHAWWAGGWSWFLGAA
jgi:hypothetical protein